MAVQAKKVQRDQFTEDGTRLFNPSKPHGTVYSDGFSEAKFIQEYEGVEVVYRGDYAPVGYRKGAPRAKTQPELVTENELLQARIKDLESAQSKTNEMLEKLTKHFGDRGAQALAPDELRIQEGDPLPVPPARPVPGKSKAT